MKLINTVLVSILILSFVISGCGQSIQANTSRLIENPYKKTEFLMGTVVTISIYDEGKEDALDLAFDRIERLADKLAVNDKDSEVDLINENAGVNPVKVSDEIYDVILAGREYSERANGSFDISIGPLTSLWHIGYPDERKPLQSEIDTVLPLINHQNIELNEEDHTVFLKKRGMKLDLGAIAKGYIADQVVSVLNSNKVTTAIINLGGNIYVMGNNPSGNKWTVGIQDPFSPRENIVGNLSVSNKSVVTSGIYERFLEVDGVKYHHLLNPKDGYPINNDIAGITIISDKSIDGDALSTSLFTKGIKEGLNYIEKIEGAEAIFVSRDKKIYMTPGIKNNFKLVNSQFEVEENPLSKS